jgi:phosphoenolpyruvate synthase/pyruvate phosphate dikinase
MFRPEKPNARFCISDAEVLELAAQAVGIEEHYSPYGRSTPMDIEWAKDGIDGQLYIVQARPETVVSQRAPQAFETFTLNGDGPVLASGCLEVEVVDPLILKTGRPACHPVALTWSLHRRHWLRFRAQRAPA